MNREIQKYYLLPIFFTLLIILIGISVSMGYIKIPLDKIFRIVFSKILDSPDLLKDIDAIFPVVVFEVRLPRILTSAVVGGGLAVSGAVFQGLLKNPLADPYTLGVSAGAAFGACFSIIFNISFFGYEITVFAFLGALLTLFMVIYLSSSGYGQSSSYSSNNLILSGIIISAILSAAISFMKYLADEQVGVIIFWLMGSFASKTWMDLSITLFFVIIGMVIALIYARDLNLISLGQKSAISLGVDTEKVTLILLVSASLVAAVCVSVSGIIGFVGLLVPHMIRFLTGPDNRRLIPISFLAGAMLLLVADTITRAVLPNEIPIGVLTAIIGGPFFCLIFRKRMTGGGSGV